jgi:hypothetical protein
MADALKDVRQRKLNKLQHDLNVGGPYVDRREVQQAIEVTRHEIDVLKSAERPGDSQLLCQNLLRKTIFAKLVGETVNSVV